MSIQDEVNLFNEIHRTKHDRSADTAAIYLGMKLEAILQQMKVNAEPAAGTPATVVGVPARNSRRSVFRK